MESVLWGGQSAPGEGWGAGRFPGEGPHPAQGATAVLEVALPWEPPEDETLFLHSKRCPLG